MLKGILFVDDEENILNGLKRSLRRMRREWNMDFALSGQEALEKLSGGNFDVIVTDMRMPGMDGAELLKRVHESYPHMIRMVLSGQCEEETILRVVRYAHFFFSKPCNAERLQGILHEYCSFIERIKNSEARSMALGLANVPILKRSVDSIRELKEAGVEDIDRYAAVISSDPMLSAKILQLAHSQFFVTIGDLCDVRKAVEVVTVRVITGLVMENESFCILDDADDGGGIASGIASHLTASAEIARKIAISENMNRKETILAYKAAFLHDIGKFVFLHRKGAEYASLHSSSVGSLIEAEKERFGFSHAELGALILCSWGFPKEVIEAVEHHESPRTEASPSKISAIVRLANLLEKGGRENDPGKYLDDWIEEHLAAAGVSKSIQEILDVVMRDDKESVPV